MTNFLRACAATLTATLLVFSTPALAETDDSPLQSPVTELRDAVMAKVHERIEAMENIAATCYQGRYGAAVLKENDEIRAFIVSTNGFLVTLTSSAEESRLSAEREKASVKKLFSKACDEDKLHITAVLFELAF